MKELVHTMQKAKDIINLLTKTYLNINDIYNECHDLHRRIVHAEHTLHSKAQANRLLTGKIAVKWRSAAKKMNVVYTIKIKTTKGIRERERKMIVSKMLERCLIITFIHD